MRKFDGGVLAALAAAALFGASTPLAKLLLAQTGPWLLAALLYLGSGMGLWLLRRAQRLSRPSLERGDALWLTSAIFAGGIAAPVLLLSGLSHMSASAASLLLNSESVFTAVIAWVIFRENVDRRIAFGMFAIVVGAIILAWPGHLERTDWWPALAVIGACLLWGIDNNLTRRVALTDASFIAMSKGLVAGVTNLVLAAAIGVHWPSSATILNGLVLGLASYGASLTLFVIALRSLGAARTGAYFSVAPFFGALLAIVLLGDPVTLQLIVAGLLMLLGVLLHLTEQHIHPHHHHAISHAHTHTHSIGDEHHEHRHEEPIAPGTRHTHWHEHSEMTHTHPHYPDAHHRHRHDR